MCKANVVLVLAVCGGCSSHSEDQGVGDGELAPIEQTFPALSMEPLSGKVGGSAWSVLSVHYDPGPMCLLSSGEDRFGNDPVVMFDWGDLAAGKGELGYGKWVTFHTPPSTNLVCSDGHYELSETDMEWTLKLYARYDDENEVNGVVTIVKK